MWRLYKIQISENPIQIIYWYLPIWPGIPTGGRGDCFKDTTPKSVRLGPHGIGIKMVSTESIFEKCPHLGEKGGVLTEIWHIRNRLSHTVPFSFFLIKEFESSGKNNSEKSVWETAEKRLHKRRSNAPISLHLHFVASDLVFASASCLSFLEKKEIIIPSIGSPKWSRCGPILCSLVRNAWGTPGAIHLYRIRCILSQVTSSPRIDRRGYHVGSGITPPFPSTYRLPKLILFSPVFFWVVVHTP